MNASGFYVYNIYIYIGSCFEKATPPEVSPDLPFRVFTPGTGVTPVPQWEVYPIDGPEPPAPAPAGDRGIRWRSGDPTFQTFRGKDMKRLNFGCNMMQYGSKLIQRAFGSGKLVSRNDHNKHLTTIETSGFKGTPGGVRWPWRVRPGPPRDPSLRSVGGHGGDWGGM